MGIPLVIIPLLVVVVFIVYHFQTKTDVQEAMDIAERLRTNVSSTICPTNNNVTISLGVGSYHSNRETNLEFFSRVDKALYLAKMDGRNRVVQSDN